MNGDSTMDVVRAMLATARARPSAIHLLAEPVAKPDVPRRYFSPWQVESLLNQAQDLLERNLRERTLYEDLRAREITQRLDMFVTEAQLASTKKRLDAKAHLLAEQIAKGEHDAHAQYAKDADDDADMMRGWAEITRINKYLKDEVFPEAKEDARVSRHLHAPDWYKTAREHQKDIDMVAPMSKRQRLAEADREQVEETYLSLRQAQNDRVAAADDPSGALNLADRFAVLGRQLVMDLSDARARADAAQRGLVTYFGYGRRLTDVSLSGKETVNELSVWVRSAISWLVAFGHSDQAVTATVSLRRLVGEAEWNSAMFNLVKAGQAKISVRWNADGQGFLLPYARLTGISSIFVGGNESDILRLNLDVPSMAVSWQTDLKGPIRDVVVPQSASVLLGRVLSSRSPRQAEICGAISLRNLSPLSAKKDGEWRIEVATVTTGAPAAVAAPDDIVIELGLNVAGGGVP